MYVYYDPETGAITSTMITSIAPPPGTFIEVPDGDLGDLFGLSVVNGEIVTSDVVPYQNLIIEEINRVTGFARSMFITDSVAQQMIYLGKRDEAIAYLADPDPNMVNYPFLAAETGITAPTAYELAQLWLNMQGMWLNVAAILEAMRMDCIDQVRSATSRAVCDELIANFRSDISVYT